jgi:hypothetical protein
MDDTASSVPIVTEKAVHHLGKIRRVDVDGARWLMMSLVPVVGLGGVGHAFLE